jgi:hypothetical protein
MLLCACSFGNGQGAPDRYPLVGVSRQSIHLLDVWRRPLLVTAEGAPLRAGGRDHA